MQKDEGGAYNEHEKPEPGRVERDELAEPRDVDKVPSKVHHTLLTEIRTSTGQRTVDVVLGGAAHSEEGKHGHIEHQVQQNTIPTAGATLEEVQTEYVQQLEGR